MSNKFSISVIDELLYKLHEALIFSKIDLQSGYYKIRMKLEDVHKITFKIYERHYEFLVIHFDLTNTPVIF